MAPASLKRLGLLFLRRQARSSISVLFMKRLVLFFWKQLVQMNSRPVESIQIVGSSYKASVWMFSLKAFCSVQLASIKFLSPITSVSGAKLNHNVSFWIGSSLEEDRDQTSNSAAHDMVEIKPSFFNMAVNQQFFWFLKHVLVNPSFTCIRQCLDVSSSEIQLLVRNQTLEKQKELTEKGLHFRGTNLPDFQDPIVRFTLLRRSSLFAFLDCCQLARRSTPTMDNLSERRKLGWPLSSCCRVFRHLPIAITLHLPLLLSLCRTVGGCQNSAQIS
jgi:hypothetical protein